MSIILWLPVSCSTDMANSTCLDSFHLKKNPKKLALMKIYQISWATACILLCLLTSSADFAFATRQSYLQELGLELYLHKYLHYYPLGSQSIQFLYFEWNFATTVAHNFVDGETTPLISSAICHFSAKHCICPKMWLKWTHKIIFICFIVFFTSKPRYIPLLCIVMKTANK